MRTIEMVNRFVPAVGWIAALPATLVVIVSVLPFVALTMAWVVFWLAVEAAKVWVVVAIGEPFSATLTLPA